MVNDEAKYYMYLYINIIDGYWISFSAEVGFTYLLPFIALAINSAIIFVPFPLG